MKGWQLLGLFLLHLNLVMAQSRLPDQLLQRTDLQEVVALQVARNGEQLILRLSAPDAKIRARAAFALASVQDKNAMPKLLALLRDPIAAVRFDAAFALGQLADSTASTPLLSAFAQEGDLRVRVKLLEALGKKGSSFALTEVALLNLPPELQAAQALSLARFGLRGKHDARAIQKLAVWLTAPHPELRENAAYYFRRISQTKAWESVANQLRLALDRYTPDDPTAAHLILALNRLKDPQDTPRFIAWLKTSPDWRTRVHAAMALGSRTTETLAQVALWNALDDPSLHVQLAAANAWAAIKTPDLSFGLDPRKQFLAHQSHRWRIAGLFLPVWAQTEPYAIRQWMDYFGTAPQARALALTALGKAQDAASFAYLQAAVQDPSLTVAHAALNALQTRWANLPADSLRAEAYAQTFIQALKRNALPTSFSAAEFLGKPRFAPFGTAKALIEAYQAFKMPQDFEVMEAFIKALGNLGDLTALPFLSTCTKEAHPLLKHAAETALAKLQKQSPPALPKASPAASNFHLNWTWLKNKGINPKVEIETTQGKVVLQLETEQAPQTVASFLALTEAGALDGLPYHRVVSNFVVQGGDVQRAEGFGGPDYTIRSEFTHLPYGRGTLGMASAGKDTEGSQYFITHSMQPHLDGNYTAFGRVLSGMETIDRIMQGDRAIKVRLLK